MMNNIMVQDLAANESTINSSVYLDSYLYDSSNLPQITSCNRTMILNTSSKSTTEGKKT